MKNGFLTGVIERKNIMENWKFCELTENKITVELTRSQSDYF